jgi:hypothetical protein
MTAGRIRHTAAFTLAHPEGSAGEQDFLEAAGRLAAIPGVEAFELLAEVSPKNGYRESSSAAFRSRSRSPCDRSRRCRAGRRRKVCHRRRRAGS